MQPKPSEKLTTLEAGRGLAALLVVLYHTTEILSAGKYYGTELFDGLFRIGHIGVDFFFVLSGFIILYVHRGEIGRPGAVGAYLRKRLIRIYPVYWIVTGIVAALMICMPGMPAIDPLHLMKSMLLLPQQEQPLVGVGWTLIFEMFFYLLFALLMIRPCLGGGGMALLVLSVLIAQFGGMHFDEPRWSLSLSFLLNLHHLEFFMGMAVAELVRRTRDLRHGSVLSLAALFALSGLIGIDPAGIRYYVGFACCFALTIYLLVVQERNGKLAAPAWMVRFGGASYSTYLVHYIALSAVAKAVVAVRDGLSMTIPIEVAALILVVSAIAAGLLFYAFVEAPLLRTLRRRFC